MYLTKVNEVIEMYKRTMRRVAQVWYFWRKTAIRQWRNKWCKQNYRITRSNPRMALTVYNATLPISSAPKMEMPALVAVAQPKGGWLLVVTRAQTACSQRPRVPASWSTEKGPGAPVCAIAVALVVLACLVKIIEKTSARGPLCHLLKEPRLGDFHERRRPAYHYRGNCRPHNDPLSTEHNVEAWDWIWSSKCMFLQTR